MLKSLIAKTEVHDFPENSSIAQKKSPESGGCSHQSLELAARCRIVLREECRIIALRRTPRESLRPVYSQ